MKLQWHWGSPLIHAAAMTFEMGWRNYLYGLSLGRFGIYVVVRRVHEEDPKERPKLEAAMRRRLDGKRAGESPR